MVSQHERRRNAFVVARFLSRRRFILDAFFAVIFCAVSIPLSAQQKLQPLSDNERGVLTGIAGSAINTARPPVTTDVTGDERPGRELILIERRPLAKNANERFANVYLYDYASDEAVQLIVNLATREVTESHRLKDVQLPLNSREENRTLRLLFNDPASRTQLSAAFQAATGRDFTAIADIKHKAFIFRADSVSDDAAWQAGACGIRRCAKVLLYTADDVVIDFSPVVDLSAGRVVQMRDRDDHMRAIHRH